MLLTDSLWLELKELGVLDGGETCALCREQPAVLLDVARAPVLLCPAHARQLQQQLAADLSGLQPPAAGRP